MKFCHISDTHLGFNAYRKVDPVSGINQRELDADFVFEKAVDKIIDLKPDFVIHTGDLFDSYRPANRVVSFALKQLIKLSEVTKVIIISGNHSTPKTFHYGSIFELFEFFPQLNTAYKGSYQTFQFGKSIIHAVPQCLDDKQFHCELKKVKIKKDFFNILAVHCGIGGLKQYSMDDFRETLLPQEYLGMSAGHSLKKSVPSQNLDFDYIALGHYHGFSQVNNKTFYSGSTERFSLNEADEEKGFIYYDLTKKKVSFITLPARKMFNLRIDCLSLSPVEVKDKISSLLKSTKTKNSIFKLKLDNLSKETYREIDNDEIKKLSSNAIQFIFEPNLSNESGAETTGQEIGNINQEFIKFTNAKENSKVLTDIGLEYLKKAAHDAAP